MVSVVKRRAQASASLLALLAACSDRPVGSDSSASGGHGSASTAGDTGMSGTGAIEPDADVDVDVDSANPGPDSTDGSETTTTSTSDTADASSSGEPELPGCVFPHLHGPELPELSVPGLAVYEGCEPDELLMERFGTVPTTTTDDVSALLDQSTLLPGGVPGLYAVGVGLCCSDIRFSCVSLYVQAGTSIPDLVAYVDATFADSDACFGLEVRIDGA